MSTSLSATPKVDAPPQGEPRRRRITALALVTLLLVLGLGGGAWLYLTRSVPVTDAASLERALERLPGVVVVTTSTTDDGAVQASAEIETWEKETVSGVIAAWEELRASGARVSELVAQQHDARGYLGVGGSSLHLQETALTVDDTAIDLFLALEGMAETSHVWVWLHGEDRASVTVGYKADLAGNWYSGFSSAISMTDQLRIALGGSEELWSVFNLTILRNQTVIPGTLAGALSDPAWEAPIMALLESHDTLPQGVECYLRDDGGPAVQCTVNADMTTSEQEILVQLQTLVEGAGGSFTQN